MPSMRSEKFAGRIIICPPSATSTPWAQRFPDPVVAFASGWMSIRQRAKAGGIELPLVLSDHADWDELTATAQELAPRQLWVTHGEEEALVHWANTNGLQAQVNIVTERSSLANYASRYRQLQVKVKEVDGSWTTIPHCASGLAAGANDSRCLNSSVAYENMQGTNVDVGIKLSFAMKAL